VKLDDREFRAAFKEYAIAYKKDFAYLANRQALNVAIKTGQRTPIASRGKIEKLPKRLWWPMFVAKRIYSDKGVRVKVDGKSRKIKGSKGRKNKKGALIGVKRYTRAEARLVSQRLIEARLRRVGFIRSGWAPAIRELKKQKLRAKFAELQGISGIKRPKGTAYVARAGVSPLAIIINHSQGAERVGARALQEGLNAAAVDMRGFVKEQCGQTAKKFNAKK
jgi:hypothetical protein